MAACRGQHDRCGVHGTEGGRCLTLRGSLAGVLTPCRPARCAGCYIAIDNHVDVRGPLQKIGLLSSECALAGCRRAAPLLVAGLLLHRRRRRPSLPRHPPCNSTHALARSPPTTEEAYDDAAQEGADAAQKGWLDRALTGGSSTLALAFLCNKALFPVRTPITLALTPAVAR